MVIQAGNTFDFNGNTVRVVLADDGEPRWVASDVAKALDYRHAPDMHRHVDEEDKGVAKVQTPGGPQEMIVLTESGLYAAVLRSSKPVAKVFKRWVTSEVLPTIRKRGVYVTKEVAHEDPATLRV